MSVIHVVKEKVDIKYHKAKDVIDFVNKCCKDARSQEYGSNFQLRCALMQSATEAFEAIDRTKISDSEKYDLVAYKKSFQSRKSKILKIIPKEIRKGNNSIKAHKSGNAKRVAMCRQRQQHNQAAGMKENVNPVSQLHQHAASSNQYTQGKDPIP